LFIITLVGGETDTYPCPWCEAERPRARGPCPQCGHVDRTSFLPHHVRGLPGGNAVAETPFVIKVLIVALVLWLLLTAAMLIRYG
jgi:hypothetical protein